LVGINIASATMGAELNSKEKPGLDYNRHISGYAVGTQKLASVEIIRNGSVIKVYHPEKDDFNFGFDDNERLSNVVIKSNDDRPPFVFYYLRVTQEDGHIAWSSPIWIDQIEGGGTSKKVKKK